MLVTLDRRWLGSQLSEKSYWAQLCDYKLNFQHHLLI